MQSEVDRADQCLVCPVDELSLRAERYNDLYPHLKTLSIISDVTLALTHLPISDVMSALTHRTYM